MELIDRQKVLDNCETDAVTDDKLNRDLGKVDDIRVEFTLNNALKLSERKGPDVVEIFSQPRLFQVVAGRSFGGTSLRPGFSLDLTMDDPATGLEQARSAIESHQTRAGRQVILRFRVSPLHFAFAAARDQPGKARPQGHGKGAQGREGPCQVLH